MTRPLQVQTLLQEPRRHPADLQGTRGGRSTEPDAGDWRVEFPEQAARGGGGDSDDSAGCRPDADVRWLQGRVVRHQQRHDRDMHAARDHLASLLAARAREGFGEPCGEADCGGPQRLGVLRRRNDQPTDGPANQEEHERAWDLLLRG